MRSESNPKETEAPGCCMSASRTTKEIEEIVVHARLALYNRDMPCGPRALRKHLEETLHVRPLSSERTIARILANNALTHSRTGWYPGDSPESVTSQSPTVAETTERR